MLLHICDTALLHCMYFTAAYAIHAELLFVPQGHRLRSP